MKTTKRHFEIFVNECKKWINVFELNNWEIFYVHAEVAPSRAWVVPSVRARNAKIYLGSEWINLEPDVITGRMLRCTAFHEVCELLIEPICWLGECRYLGEGEMAPARHDLIGKLETAIFSKKGRQMKWG